MTTADPVDGARHRIAVNARYSMPPLSHDGINGGYPPPGASTPLPHIDDVRAFPSDIDRKLPMKHLLELAESAMANSEMSRDFGKPSLALRDYVKASVIAVQIIPSHNDYVDLKGGRSDWNQRHSNLLKRIAQKSDAYDKIKQDIVADNLRTGVRPTTGRASTQGSKEDSLSARSSFSYTRDSIDSVSPRNRLSQDVQPHTNGSANKIKPAIQPKPQSLAGNAIKPGHTRNSSSISSMQATSDLATRFANLRGPQPSPGQDPRIKTHQIVPSKPAGPREMPPPRPKISIDNSIPELPKMPDAIYSPARANITGESARMQASTPRGHFSRTGSSASINSIASTSQQQPPQNSDYFSVQPQSYSRNGTSGTSGLSETLIKIPDGPTITAQELFEAMKAKWSTLIIDVRPRDDFDEGHIMSTATICIEPSILTRENVSADDISESLVLSPSEEQMRFEKRETFDLVVLYDDYSTKIVNSPRNPDELALSSLCRALVHLNYNHELKNRPKLLEGGLDAWVDFLGASSLQSTTSRKPTRKPEHRLMVNHRPFQRRPSQYLGKPLRPDVVKVWQEAVENEEKETETATEQAFHRSTESFLRRFPSLSQQESMTSPTATKQRPPSYGSSHQVDLYTDLPSPPTRPAPALPRLSYSSLSQTVDEDEMYNEANPVANTQPPERTINTGLNNPHNWCYANSTLQSLLASPEFGRELSNSEWVSKYRVPRTSDEKIDPPQLMIKIISNLFHWMTTGKFPVMKAQTLMDFSLHLCQNNHALPPFGGSGQQDAQEFMSFLFDNIHDETNLRRNLDGKTPQPKKGQKNLLHGAMEYWRNHQNLNQSIVDEYWRGIELQTVDCQECNNQTHTYSTFDLVFVQVDPNFDTTLEWCLQKHASVSKIDGFDCDSCRRKTRALTSSTFARMPKLLCLVFSRFEYMKSAQDIRKSTSRVTWDFDDVDFTPFFLRWDEQFEDKAFSGPFVYECYAVIVHSGSRTNNGHYYAYVRDSNSHDPYGWLCCNDSTVTKVRIGSGDSRDIKNQVFKSGTDKVPYLAFFRRKTHKASKLR